MQGIVLTSLKTAQYLKCAKGHGRGPVSTDQRPEIFAALLKTFEGGLTLLARLPLQIIEHPAPVIADLYAGTQEAVMAHGQTLALGGQGGHQGGLLTGFDVKFDQLVKLRLFSDTCMKTPSLCRKNLAIRCHAG